jgi:hypothetical protein
MRRGVRLRRVMRRSHRSCVGLDRVCARATADREKDETRADVTRAPGDREACHVVGCECTIHNHRASDHRHTNPTPTVIKKKTGASFDAPASLTRPYCLTIPSCDHCGRRFPTRDRLQMHETSGGCCLRSFEERQSPAWLSSGRLHCSSCPRTTSQRRY